MRKIITIAESKCNGCGLCVPACHEGAIGIAGGKAKLLRDDYCDGLGDCLPVCPVGAISFEEREAAAYDEAAVKAKAHKQPETPACGCPGAHVRDIRRAGVGEAVSGYAAAVTSHLNQWPVQMRLVPPDAPCFNNANLLVAADCAAYAHGNFHNEFMRNRTTIIGCPKLDAVEYSEKLTAILQMNAIQSVMIARMEVPCCGGMENAAKTALRHCGKRIPQHVVTITTDGRILDT